MSEIVVNFKADTSDFNSEVQKSIEEIQKLGKKGESSATELNEAYQQLGKQIAQSMGSKGVNELAKATEQAEKEATRLGTEYRKALDEVAKSGEKPSEYIKQIGVQAQEASKQANAYSQALSSAQNAVQNDNGKLGFFERVKEKVHEATSGMADISSAVNMLPQPLQNVMGKVTGVLQTFQLMAKIPLLAVINALVYAFQMLSDFMSSTTKSGAEGLEDLKKKGEALNKVASIFKATIATIQNLGYKVGESLSKAFENPKQAVLDLVDWVKQKLINQLKALGKVAWGVGQMLLGALSFDGDKIATGWEQLKEGVKDGFDNSAISTFIAEVKEAVTTTDELAEKIKKVENRKLSLQIEKINWKPIEASLDEKIREAQTKIYEETDPIKKAKAIAEAQDLINQKYAKQVQFAKEELSIAKEEAEFTPNKIETFEKIAELEANLTRLDAQRLQEGMRLTRMSTNTNLQVQKTYYDKQKELYNLMIALDKEKIQAQEDSMKKSLELINKETEEKKKKLKEQEDAWRIASGGTYSNGQVVGGTLSQEQQDYLNQQAQWIDDSSIKNKQDILVKTYETTQNKLITLADKYASEIATLSTDENASNIDVEDIKKSMTEAINNEALSTVESDSELSLKLQEWVNGLGKLSLNTLEKAVSEAESQLAEIEAKGALMTDEDKQRMMQIRAQIALAKKNADELKKTLAQKTPIENLDDLQSKVDECASSFRDLANDSDDALGDIANALADGFDVASKVITAIKTCATAEIQSIEDTATASAKAVKMVENASVILAVIGVVLQASQAIAKLFKSSNYVTQVQNDVDATNKAIRSTMKEINIARNSLSTPFGEDAWGSFIASTIDAQKYLASFNDDVNNILNQSVWSGINGIDSIAQRMNVSLPSLGDTIGGLSDEATAFEKVMNGIMNMSVQIQHSTWFRSAKYDTLANLGYDLLQYDELGNLDQQKSMEALKEFQNSDYYKKLSSDNQELIDGMIEDWDTYQDAVEQMTDSLKDWFGTLTTSFGDAIVDAFETGADASEKFKASVGDSIRSMVKNMLISQYITKYFDEASKQLAQMETTSEFAQKSPTEQAMSMAEIIMDASNKALTQADAVAQAYQAVDDQLSEQGYLSSTEANANTLSGAISGASQESIDLLSGYCNAVRINQVESIDLMREQLVTMSGVEQNTRLTASYAEQILNKLESNVSTDDSLRASGL